MDHKKPVIITLASPKGGVGKSTLTILFSYVLKNLSKKVLLIDLDPQNSLSSYFEKYIYDIEKHNVYNMLKGASYFDQCVNKINDYISIIPSHPVLRKFNKDYIDNKENLLKYFLNKKIINFDYILIDTPPSLDFLLENALYFTDYIIIPVQPERWAIESLSILMETIDEVQNINKKKYNISIVENQFIKNRNILKEVENALYKEYSEYIKGKIHYYNSIKIFITNFSEPSFRGKYYKESESILKNIFNL